MFDKREKFLPQVINYKPPFKTQRSDYDEFRFNKHNNIIFENRYRMKNKEVVLDK